MVVTGWQDNRTLRIGATGSVHEALRASIHNTNILLPYVKTFTDDQEAAADICPWRVELAKSKWFTAFAVERVALSDRPHPHPFCRAAANHILFRVAARAVNRPVTLLQIKAGKAATFARLSGQDVVRHVNTLTNRDYTRFAEASSWPTTLTTEVALLDETAQDMPLESFAGLLKQHEATTNTWLLTLNIPPEITERSESVHEHYQIRYSDDGRHYQHILESDESDHYWQPMSSLEYLTTSHLTVDGQVWTFERISSVSSSHLVVVRKGRHMSPPEDMLHGGDLVRIPAFGANLPVKWIDATIYSALLAHARTVRAPSLKEEHAKLRTYIKGMGFRLPSVVINHLAAVLLFAAKMDEEQSSRPPELQSTWHRIKTAIRRWLARHFPRIARVLLGPQQLLRDDPTIMCPAPFRFVLHKVDRVVKAGLVLRPSLPSTTTHHPARASGLPIQKVRVIAAAKGKDTLPSYPRDEIKPPAESKKIQKPAPPARTALEVKEVVAEVPPAPNAAEERGGSHISGAELAPEEQADWEMAEAMKRSRRVHEKTRELPKPGESSHSAIKIIENALKEGKTRSGPGHATDRVGVSQPLYISSSMLSSLRLSSNELVATSLDVRDMDERAPPPPVRNWADELEEALGPAPQPLPAEQAAIVDPATVPLPAETDAELEESRGLLHLPPADRVVPAGPAELPPNVPLEADRSQDRAEAGIPRSAFINALLDAPYVVRPRPIRRGGSEPGRIVEDEDEMILVPSLFPDPHRLLAAGSNNWSSPADPATVFPAFRPDVADQFFLIPDDGLRLPRRVQRPDTCMVNAIANMTGRRALNVWRDMTEYCSPLQISQAFTSAGMSVYALHRWAVTNGAAVNIHVRSNRWCTSTAHGMPHWVGVSSGTPYHIIFEIGGRGYANHWSFDPQVNHQEGPRVPCELVLEWRGGSRERWDGKIPSKAPLKPYTPNWERAKLCFKDWLERGWGIVWENHTAREREELTSYFKGVRRDARPIMLAVSVGGPGTGKSVEAKAVVKEYHNEMQGEVHVMFSRVVLMNEWKPLITKDQNRQMLKTLESTPTWNLTGLHIEEIGSFPPGYIDMRAFLNPSLRWITATGDPLQVRWSPGRETSLLNNVAVVPLIDSLRPWWSAYSITSHRLSQAVARLVGMQTTSPVRGRIIPVAGRIPGMLTIGAHEERSDRGSLMSTGYCTINSCAGLDLDMDYQIIISKAALTQLTPEACFTALTRGKRDVYLVWEGGFDQGLLMAHSVWGPAHRGETIDWGCFLSPPTKLVARFADCGWRGGENFEQKLWSLPAEYHALWAYLDALPTEEAYCEEVEATEPQAATHISAPVTLDGSRWCEPSRSKDEMEILNGLESSFQIRDLEGSALYNHIFAKQDARDETLLPLSVRQRMRFKSLRENEEHAANRAELGSILWGNFLAYLGIDPERREICEPLLNACHNAMLDKKMERSKALLEANITRVEPEQADNSARIFAKSQIKAKSTTILTATIEDDPLWWKSDALAEVKPGQTIALFPDEVLRRLGPATRYANHVLAQLMPEHVKMYGGMTPSDLDQWCKKHASSGRVFTNDFKSFDLSITGEGLHFDLCLLHWLGFGPDLLKYYYWIKVDLQTTFGHSAIMRFTGEPGTYIFNTAYNIAYMATKYTLDPAASALFSGDDSLLYSLPPISPTWHNLEKYFSLVGKTVITELPEFCGWLCYPEGIIRDPLALALKTLYRRNIGQLSRVLDSYFLEALFGYNMADAMIDLLPDDRLELQGWFMNFAFAHAPLVKHLGRTSRFSLGIMVEEILRKTPATDKTRQIGLFSGLDYILSNLGPISSLTLTDNDEQSRLLRDPPRSDGCHLCEDDDREQLRVRGDPPEGHLRPSCIHRTGRVRLGYLNLGRCCRRLRGVCGFLLGCGSLWRETRVGAQGFLERPDTPRGDDEQGVPPHHTFPDAAPPTLVQGEGAGSRKRLRGRPPPRRIQGEARQERGALVLRP